MTPEQINRLMAESGMFKYPDIVPVRGKWRIHRTDTPYYEACYDNFDPYHRIEHAMMALEKFPEYEVGKTATARYCKVWYNSVEHPKFKTAEAFADTAPAAICLACIEAKKLEVRDDTILHHNSDH